MVIVYFYRMLICTDFILYREIIYSLIATDVRIYKFNHLQMKVSKLPFFFVSNRVLLEVSLLKLLLKMYF